MVQETGETRDAIIEDDNKRIIQIIDANKNRKEKYWIVLFAKDSKNCVNGKHTIVKHIKAYDIKPKPQVGMIVGEVDNSKGIIDWDVNMPQKPFDFDALKIYGAENCNEVVTETTSISSAYITK